MNKGSLNNLFIPFFMKFLSKQILSLFILVNKYLFERAEIVL